jgi:hypothetical protein
MYAVAQPVTKVSILLFYLRIFDHGRISPAIKVSLGWMACHFVAFIFAVSLQCIPIQASWDLAISAKCINAQAVIYSAAGVNIFEDLVLIVLPIFVLKELNLSYRKRVALIFIFAMGSLYVQTFVS